ncbi:hypothetical protein AAEQ97_25845, partial [Pseudomonas aeruginosa]
PGNVERPAQGFDPLPYSFPVPIAEFTGSRIDEQDKIQRPTVTPTHGAGEREVYASEFEWR